MTAPELPAGHPTSTQPEPATTRTELTRIQKALIWAVAAGAVVIASLGFLGSYTAVVDLAVAQGFGGFSSAFPIAIDAGIAVLLALDLLLTWMRIPYPVLRQMAWGLTAATVFFNAATSWPHVLGVSMHGVIPTLFVVIVEAARHAVGRLANITADSHYENPPLSRWALSPYPTFRIWRRMRMWNIRSYNAVVQMEREAKILKATLKTQHGSRWKQLATRQEILALRLASIGTPVRETLAANPGETTAAARPASAVPVSATGKRPAATPAPTASPATGSSAVLPVATALADASDTPAYLPAPAAATTAPASGASHPAATGMKPSPAGEQRDPDEIAAVFRSLRDRLGRAPSDAALAVELGVGRSRAQQLRTAAIDAGHTDLAKPLRAAS